MADIVTPRDLPDEMTTVTDPVLSEVYNPVSGKNERVRKDNDKAYFQGTLPADISAVSTDLANLKNGTDPFSELSLSSGRTAFKELTSGTLSTSGWYTIAETEAVLNESVSANFAITTLSEQLAFNIAYRESGNAKSTANTTVEITAKAGALASGILNGINNIRLCKTDSVNGAGSKVQMYLSTGPVDATVGIFNNTGRAGRKGFNLVTPSLDDTPTLPDGVTPATFIEAGAELSLNSTETEFYSTIARKVSSDVIRCRLIWNGIPKQGTGISLVIDSGNIAFVDGAGSVSPNLTSYTLSNLVYDGNSLTFQINQTGIATALIDSPIAIRLALTTAHLEITG